MKELYSYIFEVRESTEKIIKSLSYEDLKKKITEDKKEYLESLNVVSNDEKAVWLIDYWCNKDIRGLIPMPFSRHWIMHIEASFTCMGLRSASVGTESMSTGHRVPCGGCCLSYDSQKGKRQFPFASYACYPLVNFAPSHRKWGMGSRMRADSRKDSKAGLSGGRKKFNENAIEI